MTAIRPARLVIPELGPALGRLVAPPPAPPGTAPLWLPLEDLRIALVSALFELGGDARRWAAEGERELALATLNHDAWAGLWHHTVEQVAERAAATLNGHLAAAAREARLPRRRASTLALDAEEVRALAERLAQGSEALEAALVDLDRAAGPVRSERASPQSVADWHDALLAAARRLESAWLVLEANLGREWQAWVVELEEIRTWRRPLWPLVTTGLVLVMAFGYAGLVLGGYLPVPGPFRGIAEAMWARWN